MYLGRRIREAESKEDRRTELKWETSFFFFFLLISCRTLRHITFITIYFPYLLSDPAHAHWLTDSHPHEQTHHTTNTFFSSPINWHAFPVLLTCFTHLIFTISQQFKDVHLQLASGWAVTVPVDAVFGQRDGQTLPSAALHRVIKDGSWEQGKRVERSVVRLRENKVHPVW